MPVDVSPKEPRPEPAYIGDGVYARFDGYQIWIQTEREKGIEQIALEPQVFNELVGYARKVWPLHPVCPVCLKPNLKKE